MPRSYTHIDAVVASRLREFRRAARVSQSTLGAAMGVTFQQVQKYERAKDRVSAAQLHLAGLLLGVPMDAFFREDAPPPGGSDLVADLVSIHEQEY